MRTRSYPHSSLNIDRPGPSVVRQEKKIIRGKSDDIGDIMEIVADEIELNGIYTMLRRPVLSIRCERSLFIHVSSQDVLDFTRFAVTVIDVMSERQGTFANKMPTRDR